MGRHSSPTHRVIAVWVAAGLAMVILLGWAVSALQKPDSVQPTAADPCVTPRLVRVTTSTSFAPVLSDLLPQLGRGKDCLRLEVMIVDGRAARGRLTLLETDVWIPDDSAWTMGAGDGLLAPRGEAGAHTVLATSPIYQLTDRKTAALITAAGASWAALSDLLSAGKVKAVVREPAGSGDGLIGLGALSEAVWLKRGMDAATVASVTNRRAIRSTGAAPALPRRAGEVGLVAEYALLPLLATSPADLVVLTGADRTAMLRFTWLPTAAATLDPKRRAGVDVLFRALTDISAHQAMADAGLRRTASVPPPTMAAARLPRLVAKPFDEILPHHVDHVFAAWYPADRRANLLLVVDVSGSMADAAPGTTTSLFRLVANGCASVLALLPADSRLGLWEFGSLLDPPRDHRILVPSGPLTLAHRRAFTNAVNRLTAQSTGTGLHDTILAAYRAAVAGYRPEMPNQVLVFTDALNEDDPGGITLSQLTAGLRAAADPARPVSLTVAAFGSHPAAALKSAMKPVNGSVVQVTSGSQVAAVFVHAAVGGLR